MHIVHATLGMLSVATTRLYLHARPGESTSSFISVSWNLQFLEELCTRTLKQLSVKQPAGGLRGGVGV